MNVRFAIVGSLILVLLSACQQGVSPATIESGDRAVTTGTTGLAIGADVSEIPYAQSKGVTYYDTNGTAGDGMQILYNHGYRWARIRVNVEPTSSDYGMFTNLAYAVSTGKKAKAMGYKLLVDFHYSHYWTDPANQWTPNGVNSSVSWSTTDINTLCTQVYNYTKNAMTSLVNGGASPDMVQIGNEINNGMLWPLGGPYRTGGSFKNLAYLINSGINGVKAVTSGTKIMLHVGSDASSNWSTLSYWLTSLTSSANSLQWSSVDALGLSFYPMWCGGKAAFTNLSTVLSNLKSSYSSKQVWIAETAWFYSGTTGSTDPYPRTPQGQYDCLRKVISTIQAYSNVKGVFYWGTGWTQPAKWAGSAASWAETPPRALFDATGKATKGIDGL